MDRRHILIFDDDSDFLVLVKCSLESYRFEIQQEDPGPDNIQTLKELNPEIIFISADFPDKAGFTLFNKVKKSTSKKSLIVFTTASLSAHDLSLHAKQRLHADLYLDKRDLSDNDLLEMLEKIIELGPRARRKRMTIDKDLESKAKTESQSDTSDSPEAYEDDSYQLDDITTEENDSHAEPIELSPDVQYKPGDDNATDSYKHTAMVDSTVKDESWSNDPERLITEQQAEIFQMN